MIGAPTPGIPSGAGFGLGRSAGGTASEGGAIAGKVVEGELDQDREKLSADVGLGVVGSCSTRPISGLIPVDGK